MFCVRAAMYGELWALVPFGLALAYTIVSGVGFGLPLAALVHERGEKPAGKKERRRGLSPSWEAVNLLLVAVFAALLTLYPAGWPVVAALFWPLWVAVVLLWAARLALLAWLWYGRRELGWERQLLAVISLMLPAVLAQHVTMLLTGDNDLLSHLAVCLTLGLVAVVLSVALWSGWGYRPGRRVREVARLSFWFGWVAATSTLPLALSLDPVLMANRDVVSDYWPALAGAVVAVGCLMVPVRRRYFAASGVLVASVSVGLLRLLLPYLVQSAVRLDAVAAAPQTGRLVVMVALSGALAGLLGWRAIVKR
jgi:cytochrome bd-type quinol oxidase subunit 2